MYNDERPNTHCQVCNRLIRMKRGVVWHHGFTKPEIGLQTESCFGAMHVPYEEGRDRLGEWIVVLEGDRKAKHDWHTRVATERTPVSLTIEVSKGEYKTISVDADNCANWMAQIGSTKTWEQIKANHLMHIEAQITGIEREMDACRKRWEAWPPAKKVAAQTK